MRLLFDLGHPAHVHLFRNVIKRLKRSGGSALVTSRHKDITVDLCRAYDIPQVVLSKACTETFLSGIGELLHRTFRLWQEAVRFKPHALLGTSGSIGAVAKLLQRPSFFFGEDDANVISLFAKTVYPTCTYIVTPACLKHEDHGSKHLTYPGYHELAYLHSNHFSPDPGVLQSIGLKPSDPYFVLRFVALRAHHDVDAGGLPMEILSRLVGRLGERGRVLITSEKELPSGFERYRLPVPVHQFHDVLAFASMCIGDSQTVAAEAAVLGIPNIRCNTFVGRLSYLNELETRYGLTRGVMPQQRDVLFRTVDGWLDHLESVKHEWQMRRRTLLTHTVDLAQWQWKTLNDLVKSDNGRRQRL